MCSVLLMKMRMMNQHLYLFILHTIYMYIQRFPLCYVKQKPKIKSKSSIQKDKRWWWLGVQPKRINLILQYPFYTWDRRRDQFSQVRNIFYLFCSKINIPFLFGCKETNIKLTKEVTTSALSNNRRLKIIR